MNVQESKHNVKNKIAKQNKLIFINTLKLK